MQKDTTDYPNLKQIKQDVWRKLQETISSVMTFILTDTFRTPHGTHSICFDSFFSQSIAIIYEGFWVFFQLFDYLDVWKTGQK